MLCEDNPLPQADRENLDLIRSRILKLRWIGAEDEAERLLNLIRGQPEAARVARRIGLAQTHPADTD